MTWQDAVLSFSGIIFAAACIPTIRQADKPAVSSCALTMTLLLIQAVTLATCGMWWAFSGNIMTAIAWLILLVQAVRKRRVR